MYTLYAARVLGKGFKRYLSFTIDTHQTCTVTTTITVIWCRPNGHQTLLFEPPLVSLVHQLMRTNNQLQLIMLVELSCNSTSKKPPNPS